MHTPFPVTVEFSTRLSYQKEFLNFLGTLNDARKEGVAFLHVMKGRLPLKTLFCDF